MFRNLVTATLAYALLLTPAQAADWYVDHVAGDDANPGTKEKPFKTFEQSLKALKGGDTLNLVPRDEPYSERMGWIKNQSAGTAEKPTIIDGHGAKVTRMRRFEESEWKSLGKGVFAVEFPNNVISMSGKGYYDAFPFVFAGDSPMKPVKSFDELVPGTCHLVLKWHRKVGLHDPLHKMLYIRLPEGQTPGTTVIKAPGPGGLAVETSHVIVRNISGEWSSSDLFDSAHGEGIVFENIETAHTMNQGNSAHSTKGFEVRFSRFAKSIDFGVLDVVFKDEHVTNGKYVGCVFEDNFVQGGAGFQGGNGPARSQYVVESCVFRNNESKAVSVSKTATVTLRNCVFVNGDAKAKVAITASDDGIVVLENCTFIGFPTPLDAHLRATIKATNCKFIDCGPPGGGAVANIEVVPGDAAGSTVPPDADLETLRKMTAN
jgi:hypothetical protein